jgi:hypothetical protein
MSLEKITAKLDEIEKKNIGRFSPYGKFTSSADRALPALIKAVRVLSEALVNGTQGTGVFWRENALDQAAKILEDL